MDEQNLENLNSIDLECAACDDDDDFGTVVFNSKKKDSDNVGSESRDLKTVTGITIDLSDDTEPKVSKTMFDIEEGPIKTISADITPEGNLSFKGLGANDDMTGYNAIDMETNVLPDDTDDDYIDLSDSKGFKGAHGSLKALFDDDEEEEVSFDKKELVDEEMVVEKKTTQGAVEKDYWDKVQKQHKATNKKGSYNWHFHLAGDPKREMELFNHDMGWNKPVDGKLATGEHGAMGGTSVNITGTAAAAPAGGEAAGGEGGGMGEAVEPKAEYTELFEDLLAITGFGIETDGDDKKLIDSVGITADQKVSSIDECLMLLIPYIEDSFITPLQVKTGEDFCTCKEWADWYKKDGCKQYPECKRDIDFCDLVANHAKEIKW